MPPGQPPAAAFHHAAAALPRIDARAARADPAGGQAPPIPPDADERLLDLHALARVQAALDVGAQHCYVVHTDGAAGNLTMKVAPAPLPALLAATEPP